MVGFEHSSDGSCREDNSRKREYHKQKHRCEEEQGFDGKHEQYHSVGVKL